WLGYQPHTTALATVWGGDATTRAHTVELRDRDGKQLRSFETAGKHAFYWTADGDALVGGSGGALISTSLAGKPTSLPIEYDAGALHPDGTRFAASVQGRIGIWALAR